MPSETDLRTATIRAFDRFAAEHGLVGEREEHDHSDHVAFVGTASNGKRFWIGYERQAGKAADCARCQAIAGAGEG